MRRRFFACIVLAAAAPWIARGQEGPPEGPGAKVEPPWKAGVASAAITPKDRLYMAGYAARKEPAEGTEQDLYAKALAIEDSAGERLVIITLDLIGVTAELRAAVASKLEADHGLASRSLLMNASHTHCGPAYQRDDAQPYFALLTETIVSVARQAIQSLAPAELSYSQARCGFAMNRRTPTADGFQNHPHPDGPVDHVVPVLRVAEPGGELRAVLFGYACHNTTMGFRKWLGDYAGYAQQYFQEDHPGVTAMFLTGCGGDQNPYPRSELKYARMHGRSLATAVEAALETGQKTPRHQRPLRGRLRTALDTVDLEFSEKDRAAFPYPVHLVHFGNELAIVALGSEVVVDYALRLKKELTQPAGPAIWVAGYSNVYDGYIPSERVLLEGGYEAASRPWKPELESRIVAKVHELDRQLRSSKDLSRRGPLDGPSATPAASTREQPDIATDAPITSLAFSPDGREMLAASQAGLKIYRWPELTLDRTRTLSAKNLHDMAFSPAGNRLAVGGGNPAEEGTVEIFSWPSARSERILGGHEDSVMCVAWRDDSQIASAGFDHDVVLWDAGTGEKIRTLRGHSSGVTAISFLTDSGLLVSAGVDQSLRLWQVNTGELVRSLAMHTQPVNALARRPTKDALPLIASASDDRSIRLWQPTIGRMLRFARLNSPPRDLEWLSGGTGLVACCTDGHLYRIDPETVSVTHDFPAVDGWAYTLAVHPSEPVVVVGGTGGQLHRVELEPNER